MNTQALQKTPPSTNGKPSALAVMASRVNVDPVKLLDTLKATVFKNANTEELLALVVVSNEYHLNPFLREIYAFPAKGGGIVPVVSVDGWNKMLIRQEAFDGIEFDFVDGQDGQPYSCTATVFVKNRAHPIKITEYFEECHRNTDPWNNMPRRMLRHRALCQVSRLAFGFAGVYSEDEAKDFIDVAAVAAKDAPKKLVAVAPKAEPEPHREPTIGELAAESPEAPDVNPLSDFVIKECDCTFDDFQRWGMESGNAPQADSYTGFDDVPESISKRLLRAPKGFKTGLLAAKLLRAQGQPEAA